MMCLPFEKKIRFFLIVCILCGGGIGGRTRHRAYAFTTTTPAVGGSNRTAIPRDAAGRLRVGSRTSPVASNERDRQLVSLKTKREKFLERCETNQLEKTTARRVTTIRVRCRKKWRTSKKKKAVRKFYGACYVENRKNPVLQDKQMLEECKAAYKKKNIPIYPADVNAVVHHFSTAGKREDLPNWIDTDVVLGYMNRALGPENKKHHIKSWDQVLDGV